MSSAALGVSSIPVARHIFKMLTGLETPTWPVKWSYSLVIVRNSWIFKVRGSCEDTSLLFNFTQFIKILLFLQLIEINS